MKEEKVPHLLSFSGKAQDWRMWSRKFIARASMKHYVDVLLGIEEVPEMVAVNVDPRQSIPLLW